MKPAVRSALLGLLLAVSGRPVSAQVALDAMLLGGAAHGGQYLAPDFGGRRFALSWQFCGQQSFCPFVELGHDDLGWNRVLTLQCAPAPGGGCVSAFPAFTGNSLSAGIAYDTHRWVAVRAALGGAAFSAHTRAYAGQLEGTLFPFARLAELDGAIAPLKHLGVTMGLHPLIIPDYQGDYLTYRLFTLGLRLR